MTFSYQFAMLRSKFMPQVSAFAMTLHRKRFV
jgi:hypothetical protein